MFKKSCYILLLFSCISFSQTITVDDTSYSATDLTNLLLNGSCIDPTNISYSSPQSVAQFDGNGSTFPLTEGIIIRTGIAKHTEGIYTGLNPSSQTNSSSDPTLQAISNSTGQTDLITDTAFLQFDFVPISSEFNFNFVFASNEYGQWQCGFSDVFAFLLTDSSGTTTNLAIVPGTTTPITVSTIRDNTYNGGCTSENASLFDTYNVDDPASSTLNMRGHTTVLSASSTLTPGEPYTIRLVIGDYKNSTFDSAVFIDTGSFTTEIDLGDDTTICAGDSIELTTGLDENDFSHSWTLDGNTIAGETSNTLDISQAGVYGVIAIKNGTACQIPGTITVSDIAIGTPDDLSLCNNGSATYNYDLSFNDEAYLGLDPAIYNVIYFATQADIPSAPISVNDVISYTSAGNNETIYIKILNIITGLYCNTELNFNLTVNPAAVASQPNNIEICESPNTTTVNLTVQDIQILNGLNAADFTITYYASQNDLNNQNSLGGSFDVATGTNNHEIWALIVSNTDSNCFDTTTFNIIVNPLPVVATLDDVLECTQYTLPPIDDVNGDGVPDGEYYDSSNGTGNQLPVGHLVIDGGTVYIYNGPDANGCSNESSFLIEFIDEYEPDLHNCNTFIIPPFPPGNFFTATGGGGNLLATGTSYTSTTIPNSIFYYAELTDPDTGVTTVCRDEEFNINVYDLPPATIPANAPIVTCSSYTLPIVPDLNADSTIDPSADIYYTDSSGTIFTPGDSITTSGTYTIHNVEDHPFINSDGDPDNWPCSNQASFEVTIITIPQNTTECGKYLLPILSAGEYYLQAGGVGIIIPQGSVVIENSSGGLTLENDNSFILTNPDEIFIFAPDTENIPNCTNNTSFTLQINPFPIVDELDDVELCIDTPYIIGVTDVLTNPGAFYVDDQLQDPPVSTTTYTAGQAITTDSKIYIYYQDPVTGCETQSSFEVDIRELPPLANPGDQYVCDQYTLPALNDGNYYSDENGTGTMYQAGDLIGNVIAPGTIANESIEIYLYNEWNDLAGCAIERKITVYILGINLGTFNDEDHCDSYTLPPLAVGNYFTEQQLGVSPPSTTIQQLNAGDVITTTQTIFVYAENGIPERDPALCKAEESFLVTISETPVLPTFTNEPPVCGEFLLPATSTISTTYDVNYYTAPGGNSADLINPATPRTIPEGENSPYTETIYVHATAPGNTTCLDFDSFTITIYERPNFTVSDAIICVDPETGIVAPENYVLLESGIDTNQFIVNWHLNGSIVHTGADYHVEQPGEYTVETVMIATETPPNCNYNSTTVTVLESSTAIATYSVTDDFEENATITINITNGLGTYQYQLDNGPFQDSNIFHDVLSGDHVVTILDVYGNCGIYELPVFVLKYPKFFTPNSDGINDTWNIVNLQNQPNSKINIFDRFGKFIIQIAPSGNGWNGTYNNSQLPSSDYWFVVFYEGRNGEDKEFKAHFSLKR